MRSIFSLKSALAALLLWGGGFLLAGTTAQAQDLTCSGTVIDESGLPVIGAAIVEQGSSTNGVISDVDGTFRITVPSGASLEVSCIGYVTQTVTAAPVSQSSSPPTPKCLKEPSPWVMVP